MQVKIVDRWDSTKVLFEGEFETFAAGLIEAIAKGANLEGANLEGANLEGANLRGAYLRGAYLQGADLRGAYLRGADLRGAYLRGADLRGADLRGAYLQGADLRGADLRGADLRGAYLQGADLRGAKLCDDSIINQTGETLGFWKKEVLPALLAAAPSAIPAKAWECHSWENCPMHAAFKIDSPNQAPPLLRARVAEFVWLFDNGLIGLVDACPAVVES